MKLMIDNGVQHQRVAAGLRASRIERSRSAGTEACRYTQGARFGYVPYTS